MIDDENYEDTENIKDTPDWNYYWEFRGYVSGYDDEPPNPADFPTLSELDMEKLRDRARYAHAVSFEKARNMSPETLRRIEESERERKEWLKTQPLSYRIKWHWSGWKWQRKAKRFAEGYVKGERR